MNKDNEIPGGVVLEKINLFCDAGVLKGEVEFRDPKTGELKGKIVNIALDDPAPAQQELIWRPDVNESFWMINGRGSVGKNSSLKGDYIREYNCYQHKADAERDAKYLAVVRKLRHLQRSLNGDWKPEWKASASKFFIYYEHHSREWCIDAAHVSQLCAGFYFKSRSAAETALAALTAEELEVLRNG